MEKMLALMQPRLRPQRWIFAIGCAAGQPFEMMCADAIATLNRVITQARELLKCER